MTLEWIELTEAEWAVMDAQLRTADALMFGRDPTYAEHAAERASGWPGSDGSSNSPDTMWGLRVGETTGLFRPDLATWCHDLDYRTVRRLLAWNRITMSHAEDLRARADESLLVRLMRQIQQGAWLLRHARRERALLYFEGVRVGGTGSILPRAGERYPTRSSRVRR